MKNCVWFSRALVALACIGTVIPQTALAEQPVAAPAMVGAVAPNQAPMPIVHDVMLHDGGTLYGQVLNGEGIPMVGVPVNVRSGQQQVATVGTDDQGRFQVANLQGGLYQIGAEQGDGLYRLWAPNTAPPVAQPAATLVSGANVFRGQGGPRLMQWLSNPWVIVGLIGVAVATPILLNNDNDSGS